ncbi:hypothetical protein MHK_008211, partial [Candidatus Magnetomorum sp. HK-1]
LAGSAGKARGKARVVKTLINNQKLIVRILKIM